MRAPRRSASFLRELNGAIYDWFDYVPKATRVDSPIDHAIEARKGVCQDFAHIMIALVRHVEIPVPLRERLCLPAGASSHGSVSGWRQRTHGWRRCCPGFGWVGFDPTNNLLAGDRHIRTAIGRDYADVPPTKGIFKGNAASELTVSVRVAPSDAPPPPETELNLPPQWEESPENESLDAQQQQQQQ